MYQALIFSKKYKNKVWRYILEQHKGLTRWIIAIISANVTLSEKHNIKGEILNTNLLDLLTFMAPLVLMSSSQ